MNSVGKTLLGSLWLGAVLTGASVVEFAQQPGLDSKNRTEQEILLEFSERSAPELVTQYFERPPYPLFVIRRLIDLGDPRAIPALRGAFAQETDALTKQFLAAALVRLGDSDSQYFDYVARAALEAAISDLPFRVRSTAGSTSAEVLQHHGEILAWAQARGVPVVQAIWRATIEGPAAVQALGEAGDHRALPILLRGLKSPNILVVRDSAFGLARLHDPRGMSPIIKASKRLGPQERALVAKSLLYFDSQAALRAAEAIIADPERVRRWRSEVERNGWRLAMRDRDLP